MATANTYDVVTLGETMLRFTPPDFKRIEQTTTFDLEVGGTESNLSVGLVRLGLRVAWLSRLPASPLGRYIANTLRGYGVETGHVVWSEHDRLGLYFLEEGAPPRPTQVIYDRADSAMSRMTPADLPAHLFTAGGARLLHLTGITPAISTTAAATARRALELAKAAGWLVSFDLNYRAKLWSPEEAREGCAPFIQAADLFLVPRRDAELLYGLAPDASAEAACAALAAHFPHTTLVMTLGGDGAMARAPGATSEPVHQPVFPAQPIGRIGGGDAFGAGFLYGYLTHQSLDEHERLAQGLRWGAAAAAVKYTIPGDLALIDREGVAALVAGDGDASNVRR